MVGTGWFTFFVGLGAKRTDIHLDKDMERERGRKSYLVHNMRQDVAILCYKHNTIATKPVLVEGESYVLEYV